jgi:hypothetical protein
VNTWDARAAERPDAESVDAQWSTADPGFIELLGIRLLAGRTISTEDRAGVPGVAVINTTLAQRLWPGVPPAEVVGRRLETFNNTITVIGVMANGKYASLEEEPRGFGFFPLTQRSIGAASLYVRARGSIAPAIQVVRDELTALDPNVALEQATLLESDIERMLIPQRLGSTLVGAFGIIGLVLATMGLYGVLAYTVAQRLREFGIRMALGARASDVVRLVLRRGLSLVGIGISLGVIGAVVAGYLIRSFLFGSSAVDPLVFAVVPIVLIAVALVASIVPAWRAATADPMASLRAE